MENVPEFSHGFRAKRRPLEPYFEILSTLSSRKSCSEQLLCFEFFPVWPLKALYFRFSKTAQVRNRIGSLVSYSGLPLKLAYNKWVVLADFWPNLMGHITYLLA